MTSYCMNDTECGKDEYCSPNNICLKTPSFPVKGTVIFVIVMIVYIVISSFFYKYSKNRKILNPKMIAAIVLGGLVLVLGVSSYVYYKDSISPYLAIVGSKCGETSYLKNGVCQNCPGGAKFNIQTNMCNPLPIVCGKSYCNQGQVCAGKNGDMCCDSNLICGTTCCNKGQVCVDPSTGLCGNCDATTCPNGSCINGSCCPTNQIYTDENGNKQCCNTTVCGNICCEVGQQCAQASNGQYYCANLCAGNVCGPNQSCGSITGVQKGCVNNDPQWEAPQYSPQESMDNKALCNYQNESGGQSSLWCNPNGVATSRTLTYKCALPNPTDSQCTQNDCFNTLNSMCGTYDINYVNYNPQNKSCTYTLTCDKDKLEGQCKSKATAENIIFACSDVANAKCPEGLTCCVNNPTYNNKTNRIEGNYSGKYFTKSNTVLYCYNDVPYQCDYLEILKNGACQNLLTNFMGNIPSMSSVLKYSNTNSVVLVSLAGLYYTGKFMAMNMICPSNNIGLNGNVSTFPMSDITKYITKDINSPSGFIAQYKGLSIDPDTYSTAFLPLSTANAGVSGAAPSGYGKSSFCDSTICGAQINPTNVMYQWYITPNYILEPQSIDNTFGIPVLSPCNTNTSGAATGNPGNTRALFYNGEQDSYLTRLPGNYVLIGAGDDTTNLSNSRYWFTLDKNGLLANYWNGINSHGDGTPNIAVVNAYPDSSGFKGEFVNLNSNQFNTNPPILTGGYNVTNNLTVQSNNIFSLAPSLPSQINSNIIYKFNVSPWIAIPLMR